MIVNPREDSNQSELVPAGMYILQVEDLEFRPAKNKSSGTQIQYRVRKAVPFGTDPEDKTNVGAQFADTCWHADGALWRLAAVALALGIVDVFDTDDDATMKRLFVGAFGKFTTKIDSYNGKDRTTIDMAITISESERAALAAELGLSTSGKSTPQGGADPFDYGPPPLGDADAPF